MARKNDPAAAHNAAIDKAEAELLRALEAVRAARTEQGIHWGHVGTMNHAATQAENLADLLNGTGEYAE